MIIQNQYSKKWSKANSFRTNTYLYFFNFLPLFDDFLLNQTQKKSDPPITNFIGLVVFETWECYLSDFRPFMLLAKHHGQALRSLFLFFFLFCPQPALHLLAKWIAILAQLIYCNRDHNNNGKSFHGKIKFAD